MNGLSASNFRRVYIGLLLDLIFLFLIPALLIGLLILTANQHLAAGGDIDTITTAELLKSPSLAAQASYIVLSLQYCLAALCSLLTVSGLGELEGGSTELYKAKRWFLLLMVAEATAILARITDIMLPNSETVTIVSAIDSATLLFIFIFHTLGLYRLMRGYAEVLEKVGLRGHSRRALRLSRHTIATAAILSPLYILAFILVVLDLVKPTRVYILIIAAGTFIFYIICRIRVVRCAHAVTVWIADLSG